MKAAVLNALAGLVHEVDGVSLKDHAVEVETRIAVVVGVLGFGAYEMQGYHLEVGQCDFKSAARQPTKAPQCLNRPQGPNSRVYPEQSETRRGICPRGRCLLGAIQATPHS